MSVKKRKSPTKVEQAFAKSVKPQKSFKRTFLPLFGGILVMLLVFGALNAQMIEAQWKYRSGSYKHAAVATAATTTSSTTTVDDTKSPNPEKGPLLTIPSIGVEAPIIIEPSFEEWKVQIALRNGVDHYGTTAMPGDIGNMVILGHSSGQAWAPGNYHFVFTLLDKLKPGDLIYVDYNGTRFTYQMTDNVVVKPTDTSQIQPTTTSTLSLVTCTPVGTSTNRLVVHAKLISPTSMTTASTTKAAPTTTSTSNSVPAIPTEIPGNANASLWHRFLDLF